ncbi:hypothetical protein [Paenibacillus apii]|uniref:hypothetical protein n=1 Tax=Paenibacillus apii TaxID=1850370 RepID=UPI001439382E|nr:hypothetical protein [Paenibacillus apii]NJJ38582.1 hypothetical protein [Paenibacillus apii]
MNKETMKQRLVIMLATLFSKQDRTWGVKRLHVNHQVNRAYKVCDSFGYFWRDLLPESENLSKSI